MSVTKDGDTGRWMSQIRVTDWTGKTIHKKKRGFATKKEALQWERDFISQSTGSLGMTFGDFISLYVKDMEHRLKPSTVASKKWLIDLKVTPFFKKIPLNEIKPTHVRQWQNSLTCYRDESGKPYSQTYLKCILPHHRVYRNHCRDGDGQNPHGSPHPPYWKSKGVP